MSAIYDKERCDSPRQIINEGAELFIPDEDMRLPCVVVNVSATGAKVTRDAIPPPGTAVVLFFKGGISDGELGLKFIIPPQQPYRIGRSDSSPPASSLEFGRALAAPRLPMRLHVHLAPGADIRRWFSNCQETQKEGLGKISSSRAQSRCQKLFKRYDGVIK